MLDAPKIAGIPVQFNPPFVVLKSEVLNDDRRATQPVSKFWK